MSTQLLADDQCAALRSALVAAEYTVDAVLDRIGIEGQAALGRNTTVAADVALGRARDPLATLIRLFVLQQPLPREAVSAALLGAIEPLSGAGLLTCSAGEVRADVDIRPYGADDGVASWVVSDLTPGLNHAPLSPRPDYVLGVSPASTTLAQLTMRRPVGRALDLGSGCGVQSLHLARHCRDIVATDLNPRAVALAELTFALSEVGIAVHVANLYDGLAGGYDLIVTNPPYVMSPPQRDRLVYREADFTGDGLMEAVVRGGIERLNPGGSLQVLGNWAHVVGQPWTERLAGWLGDADALVLEREVLDRHEYIEMWLTDAGLNGTPQWEPRYRAWLDYFTECGIEAVGMGWLLAHQPTSSHAPIRRLESWPHAVTQPVGDAFAAFVDATQWAADDAETWLDLSWELAPLDQEMIGRPGAGDWEHVVLRSRSGFCRAVEVTTALGGVLGACDGELPLDVLIAAVADVVAMPTNDVAAEVLGRWRELILDGIVVARD